MNTISNFHQPAPPPNWAETLGKIYGNEMDALDRHHAYLRRNDKRRVDAVIGADKISTALDNVAALTKFSATLARTLDKQKQEKFEREFHEFDIETISDVKKTLINDEIDLSKEGTDAYVLLKDSGLFEARDLEWFQKNSARNSLRLRRLLAGHVIKNHTSNLDFRIETIGEEQARYDDAVERGEVSTYYRQDLYAKLSKLDFNKKYISANFKHEIDRQAQVEGALESLAYQNIVAASEAETDLQLLGSISIQDPKTQNDFATATLQDMLKRHGKERTAGFLYRALKDQNIHTDVIYAMQNGIAKDFPGGDGKEGSGEKLFDQKTWEYILSGGDEVNQTKIDDNWVQKEGEAIELLENLWSKDSKFQTQEQWDTAILPYKGHVSEKTYALLESQDFLSQSDVHYARAMDHYKVFIENGTIDTKIEEINQLTNNRAKITLSNMANGLKKHKEDNKLQYNEGIYKAEVFAARSGETYDKNSSQLNGLDLIITGDIIAFKNKDIATRYFAQFDDNFNLVKPNPNIAKESYDAVELYKTSNGFGGDTGKFALTGDIGSKTWGNYPGVQSLPYNHNGPLSSDIGKKYNNKIKEYTSKEVRQKAVNGIFSVEQLVGYYETKKVSKDMQYIRAREKEPMSNLLEKATDALVNGGKDYAEIVEKYDLRNSSKEFPTPDRIILSKLDQKISDSSGSEKHSAQFLKAVLNQNGFESITPKQLSRLVDMLDKQESHENIQTQAAADQENVKTLQKLNSRLTELGDQDLSKFETILANPKDYPSSVVREAQKSLYKFTEEVDDIEAKIKKLNPT